MELIHGQTLLDYCDQHRLSSRQRLEVMAKICDAVQHAHQRWADPSKPEALCSFSYAQ
jgi:eukaryotic-like serine/threonine-protein kinase